MENANLKTYVPIILFSVAFLWLFLKTMKIMWKLTILLIVLIVLVLVFPGLREWIFHFF